MPQPVACNTAETLLLHEGALHTVWPTVADALLCAGVELRLDERSRLALSPQVAAGRSALLLPAREEDYRTEFGALTIAVRTAAPTPNAALRHLAWQGGGGPVGVGWRACGGGVLT